jgi:hypothetical protein
VLANALRVIVMGSLDKNTAAARPARPERLPDGRWAPGASGNAAGRPRKHNALSDAIQRGCDADELCDIALAIARNPKESSSVRIQALDWLQRCGYSRPAERHELAVERLDAQDEAAIANASDEQLEAAMQLLEAPATGQQPDGVSDDDAAKDVVPCHARGTSAKDGAA